MMLVGISLLRRKRVRLYPVAITFLDESLSGLALGVHSSTIRLGLLACIGDSNVPP